MPLLKDQYDVNFNNFNDFVMTIAKHRSLQDMYNAGRELAKSNSQIVRTCLWLSETLSNNFTVLSNEDGNRHYLHMIDIFRRKQVSPGEWFHAEGEFSLVPFHEPLIGRVAATMAPKVCRNANEWDRPKWAVSEGILSYIAVPMIHKGELVGVMSTFMNTPIQYDHIEQNVFLADYIAASIVNALAFENIEHLKKKVELENEYLREAVKQAHGFKDIVGKSQVLNRVLEQVKLVAQTDATVLIQGESGTGKELIAQAIHEHSDRKEHPLIRVNCAAIPRGLFESEFFGHVKGAFTGAVNERVGRFQLANGGTLLLDEVGEIPFKLQGKLLRVLQEGTFERIGDEKTRKVNVRIIAVTNRDIKKDVKANRFRQDLYYRLSVFPIKVPPLRERIEDIPLLAQYFISNICRRMGVREPALKQRHITQLQRMNWPGNVRELRNVMERALIISQGRELNFDGLSADQLLRETDIEVVISDNFSDNHPYTEMEWKENVRRNILLALEQSNWKVQGPGGAAEVLGVKPTTLHARMKTLGLKKNKNSYMDA